MNVIFSRKDESLFVSCYFHFSVGLVQGPTEEYNAMQGNRTRVAAGFDKNDNMGETREYGPW